MLLSKFAVYVTKKVKLIKEQQASRLLSSLGIKKCLSKIPVLGSLLYFVLTV